MAAARHTPLPLHVTKRSDRSPIRALDVDGWHIVIRKKKKKPVLAWPAGKVSAKLIGLCFNCFSNGHVAKVFPNPSYCFRCGEPGHQAQDCTRPCIPVGGRHGSAQRPPWSQVERTWVTTPPPPPSPDVMPEDVSGSTNSYLNTPPSRFARCRHHRPPQHLASRHRRRLLRQRVHQAGVLPQAPASSTTHWRSTPWSKP
jgi:hypothetical protein